MPPSDLVGFDLSVDEIDHLLSGPGPRVDVAEAIEGIAWVIEESSADGNLEVVREFVGIA